MRCVVSYEMTVKNDLDRFHRAMDVIDRAPAFGRFAAPVKQAPSGKLFERKRPVAGHGEAMPEIRGWRCRGRR